VEVQVPEVREARLVVHVVTALDLQCACVAARVLQDDVGDHERLVRGDRVLRGLERVELLRVVLRLRVGRDAEVDGLAGRDVDAVRALGRAADAATAAGTALRGHVVDLLLRLRGLGLGRLRLVRGLVDLRHHRGVLGLRLLLARLACRRLHGRLDEREPQHRQRDRGREGGDGHRQQPLRQQLLLHDRALGVDRRLVGRRRGDAERQALVLAAQEPVVRLGAQLQERGRARLHDQRAVVERQLQLVLGIVGDDLDRDRVVAGVVDDDLVHGLGAAPRGLRRQLELQVHERLDLDDPLGHGRVRWVLTREHPHAEGHGPGGHRRVPRRGEGYGRLTVLPRHEVHDVRLDRDPVS
jgi:hypothetical protein